MATAAQGRVLPLDGLRTVAVLAVMAYHVHLPSSTGGFLAVTVFFVLSGYLITILLITERRKTGTIRLGRFSLRRVLRLYPALVTMVLVGVLLWPIIGTYKGAQLSAAAAAGISLTYTGNLFRAFWHTSQGVFAQTWSLAMEEQFYLIWPTILVLLGVLRATRWVVIAGLSTALVVCACGVAAVYVSPHGSATANVYFNPLLGAPPLLAGCALAITLDDERVRAAFTGRIGQAATWVGLAALVALVIRMPSDWNQHVETFAFVLPGAAIAAAALVGGLVTTPSWIGAALSWTPLSWFGRRVSYAAYLWHPLTMALFTPFASGLWDKLGMIGIALMVAAASVFVIEIPVERLRTRLREAKNLRAQMLARAGRSPLRQKLDRLRGAPD